MTTPYQIAIHEAGHAVIGIDEDQTIDWAELIRDDGGVVVRGRTVAPTIPSITRGNATPHEIFECAKLARELFAGMHAEWRLDPNATPGVEDDMKQLDDLIETMFDDPIRAAKWKREINDEMPPLIEARWAAIQAVADNLLRGRQYRIDIDREMRAHPAVPQG